MKTIEALTDLVVLGEDEEFVSVEAVGITGRVNLFSYFNKRTLSLGFGKHNHQLRNESVFFVAIPIPQLSASLQKE